MVSADYITVSVATLCPGNMLGVNLYTHDTAVDDYRLYKEADYPLDEDDVQRLRERGVRRLFIPRGDHERYQEYLRLLLSDPGTTASMRARIGALDEVVRDVLKECFDSGDVDQTVQSAASLADLAVGLISDNEFVAEDMLKLLHHDYATFTHSANVAYYATLLGKAMDMLPADLRQIASGALLHDFGKLEISDAILWKPGPLNEFEMRRVRQHPLDGFRKLCHRRDLSRGQLMMVYQHHERLDGSGYPVGCVAEDIHPWAKINAVVDVFEALTSTRPYRGPMSAARALEIMDRESGRTFDPEIFQCWKQIIMSSSLA